MQRFTTTLALVALLSGCPSSTSTDPDAPSPDVVDFMQFAQDVPAVGGDCVHPKRGRRRVKRCLTLGESLRDSLPPFPHAGKAGQKLTPPSLRGSLWSRLGDA